MSFIIDVIGLFHVYVFIYTVISISTFVFISTVVKWRSVLIFFTLFLDCYEFSKSLHTLLEVFGLPLKIFAFIYTQEGRVSPALFLVGYLFRDLYVPDFIMGPATA